MQNDELFKYMGISPDSGEAEKINAVSKAVSKELNKTSLAPSQAVIDNIMAAAAKKNKYAIKNLFSAFSYKTLLTGALTVFIVFAVPYMLSKNSLGRIDTDIYSSAVETNFDQFDSDLSEVLEYLETI
ncbi:hypothetical protein Emin_0182 [Elusimicrobium minutum Pei191]|uniref:Uncharacterized protein n=1 Tax=Elusimicrobium minutum (strain Pei191) TaxID=445932 RepID=B2KBQ9_ELUMP|nr:hypothetical protein [Elusimicrobium minutum]ACC97746.1 hypothetical protein Emin_0182 [Elusimicrobium minutum Pei191]